MFRIVNTDNYGGDYPNESFTDDGPFESKKDAQIRADERNGPPDRVSSRYYKVVEMPYELQPGFEP